MVTMNRVVSIQLGHWRVPSLMEIDSEDGILYYLEYRSNLGPYQEGRHDIIDDYGMVDVEDLDKIAELRYTNSVKYAPSPEKPTAERHIGLIDPEGHFYFCRERNHYGVLHDLYTVKFGVWQENRRQLEAWARNWTRVNECNLTWHEIPNQAQIDTLHDIYQVARVEDLKEDIKDILEFGK